MNSMHNDPFDEQLDHLLSASVKPGAEPQSLMIPRMPVKPRFNWALAGALAACIIGPLILMAVWAADVHSAAPAAAAVPGGDLWALLTDAINSGASHLTSTTFLVYAAIAVAGVYAFAARRIVQLYRHH